MKKPEGRKAGGKAKGRTGRGPAQRGTAVRTGPVQAADLLGLGRHASDMVLLLAVDGRILDANDSALTTYGYTLEELRQLVPGGLRPPEQMEGLSGQFALLRRPEGGAFETVHRRKDGSAFPVEIRGRPVRSGEATLLLATFRDITTRVAHDREIARLSRLYAALSQINQTILRAASREQLFQEICRALIADGGFKMAWIGWCDSATEEVRPVAQSGDVGGYLKNIRVYADDRPEGRGPTGTAVREGRTYVCTDFAHDPRTGPWREAAAREGFCASIALPIREHGIVVGALTVYAGESGSFRDKEVALLEEAVSDIEFALDHLEQELRLRLSESRYRMAQAIGHVGSWEYNLQTAEFWGSDEAKRIYGFDPQQPCFSTEEVERCIPERERVHQALVDLLEKNKAYDLEFEIHPADGAPPRIIASVAQLDRDENGQPWKVVGVIQDITARKRAELEQRQTEEKFRSIFETSMDGLLLTRPDGRILVANPEACRMLGRTEEEICRMERRAIVDPGDPRAAAVLEERSRTGRTRGEVTMIRGDGSRFEAEISSTVFPTPDGPCTGVVLRDITEQKRASQRIREQAALLDGANDAIFVHELNGTISYWNEGAERLYGWATNEALGHKVMALQIGDPVVDADVQAALVAAGHWSGEQRQVTKRGETVTVFSRLSVMSDEAGRPKAVFAINTDVTEKKQLEARYLQSQRLESLGTLASGIAHDLNNVLAPILLGAPLLRSLLQNQSDRQILATIEASARRGADIVRQVLVFARGVEGRFMPMAIRHVLREVAELATETFPRNITIATDLPRELWTVVGDATQLHQIVINLCVNARDAMPNGGRLTLSAANVELGQAFVAATPGAKPGPHVRIRVADTGVGIPAEHLPKIFDPFFTTKPVGKGTGLGLPTVMGLVKQHGGFLQFTSVVGEGTCFEVYIPATPGAEPPPASDELAELPRGSGEGVLVVDDEAAIRSIATTVLQERGYRVLTAAEGVEALNVLRQHHAEIAVVLTDMLMPGMDGPTLVRELRQADPAVPIIGMTGVGEAPRATPDDSPVVPVLITKPFTARKLVFAVHDVLHALRGA